MDFTSQTRKNRVEYPWLAWYDRRIWRDRLRPMTLRNHPVCTICQRNASTVADHIIPHKGNWNLFCDLVNLTGLCATCHSLKTAKEDGGFGNHPVRSAGTNNGSDPVRTGDTGRQFQSSSISVKKLDDALNVDIDELLKGL